MADTVVSGKANFGDIYNRPDPRGYYATLGPLGYVIPQHGADVFQRLAEQRAQDGFTERPAFLDVCCSYGVGGALLKTDLRLGDLYTYYRDTPSTNLNGYAEQTDGPADQNGEGLLAADRAFFAQRLRSSPPRVVGLDIAENAVNYAVAVGLLDDGIAGNFEQSEPPAGVARTLSGINMITTTGGIGYVTARTFERLLRLFDETPWVAAFCLRQYDYTPIAELLESYGLMTERSERTFHQRRFRDEDEQQWAISELTERGLDPSGKETDGHYHAELFLSRPAADAAARPLDQMLG
jgi:hypothetical protein